MRVLVLICWLGYTHQPGILHLPWPAWNGLKKVGSVRLRLGMKAYEARWYTCHTSRAIALSL